MKFLSSKLSYNGKEITTLQDETVLEALLRSGETVSFSCREGVCQTCLMKSTGKNVCDMASQGLTKNLKDKNYFMPCICVPTEDMQLLPADQSDFLHEFKLVEKQFLNADVVRLKLESGSEFAYQPGQYVYIKYKDTDELRPYSLSSLPLVDTYLELHVKRINNGKFSSWFFDDMAVGDTVEIKNAVGDSHYTSDNEHQNILLIGTGTGLAPLLGVIKDALILNSHQGNIFLYHGGRKPDDLYDHKNLLDMEMQNVNFHYSGCVSGGEKPEGYSSGRANQVAFNRHKELAGWKVYLCGHPDMVKDSVNVALSFGATPTDIYADAFDHQFAKGNSALASTNQDQDIYESRDAKIPDPKPDLELWQALGEGRLLTKILTEFYAIIFADPRLSPFFSHVTEQRLIEKQYNFLYQMFTGKKIYFGANLRNAHHWMVISNELFDYRATILHALMKKHDLPEHLIKRWCVLEDSSRASIVKSKPWHKILDGELLILDKYEEAIMDESTICDSCHGEIAAGEKIRYHLRLGKLFCGKCAGINNKESTSDQNMVVNDK